MFGDFLCYPQKIEQDKKYEFNDFIYHPLIFSTRLFFSAVVKNYILFFLCFLLIFAYISRDSLCRDFFDVMLRCYRNDNSFLLQNIILFLTFGGRISVIFMSTNGSFCLLAVRVKCFNGVIKCCK